MFVERKLDYDGASLPTIGDVLYRAFANDPSIYARCLDACGDAEKSRMPA